MTAASAFGQGSGVQKGPATRPAAATGIPAGGAANVMRPIGSIDFYGLYRLSADRLREALTFKVGDTIALADRSFFTVSERRLMAVPGVLHTRLDIVCCENARYLVYVGIEEAGAPTLHFRPAPTGSIRLPPDLVQAGADLDRVVLEAALSGHADEDDSEGHMLLKDAAARPAEDRVIELAQGNVPLLRRVLRASADAEQRAIAAQLLGYAGDMQSVVPDLVYAMSDPSAGVRNNAMRALAVFGKATKVRSPRVPYAPFVTLLNSPVWGDRNKATFALFGMARKRDPALLKLLRERALTPLVEMARWRSQDHAQAPFWILGCIAGFSDQDIYSAWTHGDRERVIQAALAR